MKKYILLLLFLIPAICFAQVNITGKILNANDGSPFPDASIFLSNTTIGSTSDHEGNFTLSNVQPGKYTLIVTFTGFERYTGEILVEDKNINVNDIKLSAQTIVLDDVVISFDPDREKHLKLFQDQFFGWGDNASKCKILNPEVINFKLDKKAQLLHVTAKNFIQIENEALGYKVNYLLKVFTYNMAYFTASYSGDYKFEKLTGTPKAEKKWEENRKDTYRGSVKHFLRSLAAGNFKEDGFDVYTVVREDYPQFPDTNLISRLIVKDTLRIKNDTNSYYVPTLPAAVKSRPPEKNRMIRIKLERNQMFSPTDQTGTYGLRFDQLLKYAMLVIYNKKSITLGQYNFVNTHFETSRPVSLIVFNKPYALFDRNGIVTSAGSVSYSGYWGDLRVGNLLPLDYKPAED